MWLTVVLLDKLTAFLTSLTVFLISLTFFLKVLTTENTAACKVRD